MPDLNSNGLNAGLFPIKTYDTASYQINGGTSVGAGATITDSVTATGVVTSDTKVGICPRDAVVIPFGLVLVSVAISATNTLSLVWRNNNASAITPPSAGVWSAAVFGLFVR
jgi:hypothetical protein